MIKKALLAVALLAAALPARSAAPKPLAVAVAANMMPAMTRIAAAYRKASGQAVVLTPGASGAFAAQLMNGAPFDLFVSADMGYPRALEQKGLTAGKTRLYGRGTLILWSLSGLDVSRGLSVLEDSAVAHVAVADPRTAPYGKAAVAALKAAGLYDAVEPKLVYAQNISQVNQFIVSKAVSAGFAARSAVASDKWRGRGSWKAVDPELYAPIDQGLVVLKGPRSRRAERLARFILGPEGRAVLKRYGYALPPAPRAGRREKKR